MKASSRPLATLARLDPAGDADRDRHGSDAESDQEISTDRGEEDRAMARHVARNDV
jgi:hypothetical protein